MTDKIKIELCTKVLPAGGYCSKPVGSCIHSFTPTTFGTQTASQAR